MPNDKMPKKQLRYPFKRQSHRHAHGRTSNEVVWFTGAQEESLRVFFGHFLIVHLAWGFDMDVYLGFTPPEALVRSNCCP